MSRLAYLACASLFAGCVVDEGLDYGEVEQEAGKCPSWLCGPGGNSPEIDHKGLHELNLDGVANAEGFELSSVKLGGVEQTMTVYRAEVSLKSKVTGAITSGNGVIGAELTVKRDGLLYTIKFVARGAAEYWAKPGGVTKSFTTYEITWKVGGTSGGGQYEWKNICSSPPPDNASGGFNALHVVLFENDRIDARKKTVAPFKAANDRWFNIGCADHALAKLHQVGHTQAAQNATAADAQKFVTSRAERQTFLKQITADYCGGGDAFTVAGQPLAYHDKNGWLPPPSATMALEARWNENGATCLNTPRIDKNPTPAGIAEFAGKVELEIAATCRRPPACAGKLAEFDKHAWVSGNP